MTNDEISGSRSREDPERVEADPNECTLAVSEYSQSDSLVSGAPSSGFLASVIGNSAGFCVVRWTDGVERGVEWIGETFTKSNSCDRLHFVIEIGSCRTGWV